jgi:hypothetical protein
MTCAICETRRPRRFCPGVRGDICAICCGTEREVTVTCPLDCEYLREARKHDRPPLLDEASIPNRDIKITEQMIDEHQSLLGFLSEALLNAAMETPGVADCDVRDALAALVRTYRTLQSGVYYETRPDNPLAGSIHSALQNAAQEYRTEEQRRLGMTRTRDADVLALIVFLQRVELDRNNGRRRGRAFIDSLRRLYPDASSPESPDTPSLILP